MFFFCRTNKKDPAFSSAMRLGEPPQYDRFAIQSFASQGGIENWPKRILPEHANGEGIAFPGGSCLGPFDESSEVVKIRRFHLILIWLGLLRAHDRRDEHQRSCNSRKRNPTRSKDSRERRPDAGPQARCVR